MLFITLRMLIMNISIISKSCLNRIVEMKNTLIVNMNREYSDEDINKLLRKKDFFIAYLYHFLLGAIIAGFAIQPLLKYVNPDYLTIVGMWLGLTVILLYRTEVLSSVKHSGKCRIATIIVYFMLITSAISITYLLISALFASTSHDEYCRSLQFLVEIGKDSEKNSTIFNNMQCRIQHLNL